MAIRVSAALAALGGLAGGPSPALSSEPGTARSTAAAPREVVLGDGAIRVRLSTATGQILGLSGADGAGWLAAQCDRYNLEGQRSSEARDVASAARPSAGAAEFRCVNADLSLDVVKRYALEGGILTKECVYSRSRSAPRSGSAVRFHAERGNEDSARLLRVSSETRIDPGVYAQGYYFTNIDDGYKVRTAPFVSARDVAIASAWNVSTGSFNFYVPARSAMLVHHRHRLNGRCKVYVLLRQFSTR